MTLATFRGQRETRRVRCHASQSRLAEPGLRARLRRVKSCGQSPLVGPVCGRIPAAAGRPGLRRVRGPSADCCAIGLQAAAGSRQTGETVTAKQRPIVVITSNNEKELPDAFLRRCFFHYIRFPDTDTMKAIIDVHFPGIQKALVREALTIFYDIREVPGLKKKPSTSELLDWLKLLMHEDLPLDILQSRDPKKLIPPLHGALLKNEQDVMLFERLAFMTRRENAGPRS
jgi:hypothetical protein